MEFFEVVVIDKKAAQPFTLDERVYVVVNTPHFAEVYAALSGRYERQPDGQFVRVTQFVTIPVESSDKDVNAGA